MGKKKGKKHWSSNVYMSDKTIKKSKEVIIMKFKIFMLRIR